MSQTVADSVRMMHRIAINDAFRLCPDADALVATDRAWWDANPDALAFKGRKFSMNPPRTCAVERVSPAKKLGISTQSNSGLLGLHVGLTIFGWRDALLYGVDNHGTHFFGPHKKVRNTTPERFEVFRQQWAEYAKYLPAGAIVFNATPGSTIDCFPFLDDRELAA